MSNRRLVGNADLAKIYKKRGVFQPGQEVEDENGNIYRFITYNAGDGAVAAAAGLAIWGLDSAYDAYEGTADGNSATIPVLLNRPLGFLMAAPADGQECFAQKWGPSKNAMTTTNAVAQGEILEGTTGDGVVEGVAAPTNLTYTSMGIALEDDSGTTLAAGSAFIDCP
jgi:hypothetical protein